MKNNDETIIEDLDNVPGTVPTISNHISLMQTTKEAHDNENNINSNNKSHKMNNHVNQNNNLGDANESVVANGPKTFRSMLEEAENYPIDM